MSVGAIIGGVAAVAGAGASIYGASQSGSGGSAPPPMAPGKSLLSYLKGLDKGLPQLLGMEGSYRPQFGQLNIADQTQYLNALLGLAPGATDAAGQQLQAARQKEFAIMLGNTGSVNSILDAISPGGRAAANNANTLAQQAFDRSQGPLSFEERRGADQASRESFAARGRINDTSSIIGEFLGREDVRAAKREEARALGNSAFQLNQSFTDPALSILMGIPAATSLGQDYLGMSAGAIGANSPQFINPDAGINMGMQHNANLAAYQNAQAARSAGTGAAWADAGSALLGLAGNYFKNQ